MLLYSSFLFAILEVAPLGTPQPTACSDAATLCEGGEVAHKCKHPKGSKKLADQFRIDQLL